MLAACCIALLLMHTCFIFIRCIFQNPGRTCRSWAATKVQNSEEVAERTNTGWQDVWWGLFFSEDLAAARFTQGEILRLNTQHLIFARNGNQPWIVYLGQNSYSSSCCSQWAHMPSYWKIKGCDRRKFGYWEGDWNSCWFCPSYHQEIFWPWTCQKCGEWNSFWVP